MTGGLDTVNAKFPVVVVWADRVSYVLLLLLALSVSMPYLPLISMWQIAGFPVTIVLHHLMAAVFVLLLAFSLVQGHFEDYGWMFRVLIVFVALILLDYLVLKAFFGVDDFVGEIRQVLISLCALWIGWRQKLDERKMIGLIWVFTLGILLVGVLIVFIQGNGFHLTGEYFAEYKNSVGPILATAAVSCAGMALDHSNKRKIGLIVASFAAISLCVLLILIIRARASLLAVVLLLLLMVFRRFKGRYPLLSVWVAILMVAVTFILLPNSIKQSVHQSLFSGYSGGDITAGRMERNYQAISVLEQNPLWGHLVNSQEIDRVHNYPLCQLYRFGLLGALPLLLIYFFLLFKGLKELNAHSSISAMIVGYYALLIGFVVSLFEYSFPFGPGTSTVVAFIFFGVALKSSSKTENTSDDNLSMDNINGI